MPSNILAKRGHIYKAGKRYCHNVGLSCAFRQWRAPAESHCRYIHGYALQVELEFEAVALDTHNWVQDFGGLKKVKKWLEDTFDHRTLIAEDDPQISIFRELAIAQIVDLNVVDDVGCESFARMIFEEIKTMGFGQLQWVTVREHDGNWASYGRDLSVGSDSSSSRSQS